MADKYGNPWPKYRNHAQKKLSPLVAVRHYCLDCCCEVAEEVKLCPVTACPLWPFRFGAYPEDHRGPKTVLKPINLRCRDCAPEPIQGKPEWQSCMKKCCPLWHLRFGTNPRRKGLGGSNLTDELRRKGRLAAKGVAHGPEIDKTFPGKVIARGQPGERVTT
jgi:hypothetical protein